MDMVTKLAKVAYARFYGLDWSEAQWEDRGFDDSYQEYLDSVATNPDLAKFPNVWRGEEFMARTRAVLQALREPNEEMVEAGAATPLTMDNDVGHAAASRVFTTMIDKALGQ